jgi:pantothenate kinase-related protein Tda10
MDNQKPTLYLIRGVPGAGESTFAKVLWFGLSEGAGKVLDAGLDMSFKLYNQHKLFSEQMIEDFMQSREVVVTDGHKPRES